MNSDQFSIIEKKLNTVIKLLAIQAIGDKEYRQQITLLDSMGLQINDIAELTGKTANNVKVTLHLIRKNKSKGEKKDE
jgi:DNA-directed RNA polymerase specialized sigma24 family protein